VVQEGLQKGDKIIVEGVAGLRDGMSIKPREINSDSLFVDSR
jgi:cobyrinic acid a,c-diamide synthase